MEKEITELKQLVKNLESELEAAMQREEILLNPTGGASGLKQKLKRTRLGRIAADPNSKLGKVVRSPRTIFRIITHPEILKEMKNEKDRTKSNLADADDKEAAPLFVPIKFFFSDFDELRVNLVTEKIDLGLMRMAIELANKNKAELRVVTYGEMAGSVKYGRMVEEKQIPVAKRISFYSSVDQSVKNKVFELEVGKRDIFITRAWKSENE